MPGRTLETSDGRTADTPGRTLETSDGRAPEAPGRMLKASDNRAPVMPEENRAAELPKEVEALPRTTTGTDKDEAEEDADRQANGTVERAVL